MENLTYKSEFIPEVVISIILSDNPNYEKLKPIFDQLGYGFMVPNQNLIIIDGEQFIDNFDSDVLKFIEAHEIAHIIMGHDTDRNEDDEIDADLGAYFLLKKHNKSVDPLINNFYDRHGIDFDEKLLKRVEEYF